MFKVGDKVRWKGSAEFFPKDSIHTVVGLRGPSGIYIDDYLGGWWTNKNWELVETDVLATLRNAVEAARNAGYTVNCSIFQVVEVEEVV